MVLALITTPLHLVHDKAQIITDFINAFVFWFAFPVGLGYYLITRDKKWFGWGVFFSIYIVALLGLIVLLIVVTIAMVFNLA